MRIILTILLLVGCGNQSLIPVLDNKLDGLNEKQTALQLRIKEWGERGAKYVVSHERIVAAFYTLPAALTLIGKLTGGFKLEDIDGNVLIESIDDVKDKIKDLSESVDK